jgi:hypothetical protein
MNDKTTKTEYTSQTEPSTYQTGSTKPPKSRLGLILILLGLVIFLGGIATALGLTNLQLFRALSTQAEPYANAVQFSDPGQDPVASNARQTGLGFYGETVSEFWHTYHQLPRGVFVQSVDPDSDAARQGILPGDIVMQFNNRAVSSVDDLQNILADSDLSQPVPVVLHRDGHEITILLHLPQPAQ